MSTTNLETVHPDEILTPWNREILSPNAVRLYEAIWHYMRNLGQAAIWLSDDEASRRAKILIRYIPAARAELINTQLLEGREGARQWKYSYLEQRSPEFDDADVQTAQNLEAGQ
jgi:hypothetical protein